MTLHLSGYFDNNFGDDYMMKLVIRSLPDIRFVIEKKEKANSLILTEKNVESVEEIDKNLKKLVVIGSGFMINSAVAAKSEVKMLLRGDNPGDYCLGCNIEPFKNKFREYLIKRKLQKFGLIVCRDKNSFQWLKQNNKKSKIECLPDMLFSLPDDWLEPEIEAGNKLGISVMNTGNDEKSCEYRGQMSEVADFYIQSTGHDVVLFAFNSGAEDDISACENVRNLSKFPEKIKIVSHGTQGEIIKAYRSCCKIIATRFHSAVLAIRMGIDMYPIVYREKMRNMLNDINYHTSGCDFERINTGEIKEFTVACENPFRLSPDTMALAKGYSKILRNFVKNNI